MAGATSDAARALGYSVHGVRIAATAAGGFIAAWAVPPLALLPRQLERGAVQRPGPDRGGPGHLRPLEPWRCLGAALLFGGAGAIGPALQSVGITAGYYLFNVPLRADAADPGAHLLAPPLAQGRTGRAGRLALNLHPLSEPAMPTLASSPYAWPYNGDLRPANTALVIIDMQTDFCGVGGYVDKMGYDLSLTRADRADQAPAGRGAPWACTSSTPAKATGRTSPTCRPTQALAQIGSNGAGIGDMGPCGRILVRGEPAGTSSPSSTPSPASPSSTSRARAASAPPTWN
jgi:hypothetical protein